MSKRRNRSRTIVREMIAFLPVFGLICLAAVMAMAYLMGNEKVFDFLYYAFLGISTLLAACRMLHVNMKKKQQREIAWRRRRRQMERQLAARMASVPIDQKIGPAQTNMP